MGSGELEELSRRSSSSDIELSSSAKKGVRGGSGGARCSRRTFVALNRRQTVCARRGEGLLCKVAGMDEFDWEGGVGGVRHGTFEDGEGISRT